MRKRRGGISIVVTARGLSFDFLLDSQSAAATDRLAAIEDRRHVPPVAVSRKNPRSAGNIDVPTPREVAVSAVAANASHHVLVLVRIEVVFLIGRRIGVHLGGIIATARALIAIRLGVSSVSL